MTHPGEARDRKQPERRQANVLESAMRDLRDAAPRGVQGSPVDEGHPKRVLVVCVRSGDEIWGRSTQLPFEPYRSEYARPPFR